MRVIQQIIQKLEQAFSPSYLDVINESDNHQVAKGSETHFKVVVVSDFFSADLTLLARHRAVNQVLADELKNTLHALAIHTYSKQEWQARKQAPNSPNCLGGSLKSLN